MRLSHTQTYFNEQDTGELEHRQGQCLDIIRAQAGSTDRGRRTLFGNRSGTGAGSHAHDPHDAAGASGAAAAALPLHLIELPDPYTDQDWEAVMGDFVRRSAAQGVESMAFGDLFLEDIRAHREESAGRYRHSSPVPTVGNPHDPTWQKKCCRRALRPIYPASISNTCPCAWPAAMVEGIVAGTAGRRRPLWGER